MLSQKTGAVGIPGSPVVRTWHFHGHGPVGELKSYKPVVQPKKRVNKVVQQDQQEC